MPAPARVKAERAEPRPNRRRVGGVDVAALKAELGLVDSRLRCARRNKGAAYRVGAYTLEERAALLARFHSKRGRRIWRKKIKYDCRKKLADKRPRLKGRFVTQEELDGLDPETLAKVTGLGSFEAESSGSDVEDDSDSSEGFRAPAYATSRGRGGGRCRGAGRREVCESSPPAQPSSARPRLKAQRSIARARQEDGNTERSAEVFSSSPCVTPDPLRDDEMSTSAGEESKFCRSKVSAMFEVSTDAGVERDPGGQESGDQIKNEDGDAIKVQTCEPTDLVSGFIVDEILSSNFNIIPTRDMEAIPAGVTVN